MKTTMGTWRLAGRLLGSHLTMMVISFVLFESNSFTLEWAVVNVLISVLCLVVYWNLGYMDAFRCGENDTKQEDVSKPYQMKGFVAGSLTSLVPLLLLCLPFSVTDAWFRLFCLPYRGILYLCQEALWLKVLILFPFPVVTGIGYLHGRKRNNWFDKLREKMDGWVYQKK